MGDPNLIHLVSNLWTSFGVLRVEETRRELDLGPKELVSGIYCGTLSTAFHLSEPPYKEGTPLRAATTQDDYKDYMK